MGDFTYTLIVIQIIFVSQYAHEYSLAQYSQGLAALFSLFSLSFLSLSSALSLSYHDQSCYFQPTDQQSGHYSLN